LAPEERPFMMLKAMVATQAAQPNQKKAVEAWASRQRFSVLWLPLVMWLVRV
jgi:hypothetical protein